MDLNKDYPWTACLIFQVRIVVQNVTRYAFVTCDGSPSFPGYTLLGHPWAKIFWQTNIVFNKKVAICQLPSLILSLGFDAWFHFISKISQKYFQKASKIISMYTMYTISMYTFPKCYLEQKTVWQTNIVFYKKVAICRLPSLILSLGFDAWFHFISRISPDHFQKTSKIISKHFQNATLSKKTFRRQI